MPFDSRPRGGIVIAKDLMPWLFVGRKAPWTPFAKVRCEGGKCTWVDRRKERRLPRVIARPVAA